MKTDIDNIRVECHTNEYKEELLTVSRLDGDEVVEIDQLSYNTGEEASADYHIITRALRAHRTGPNPNCIQVGVVLSHCYEGENLQLLARFYLDGQFISKEIVLQAPVKAFTNLSPLRNTLAEYQAAVDTFWANNPQG